MSAKVKEKCTHEDVQNKEDTGPKCLEIKPLEQKQEVKSVTETVPEKSEVAVGSQSKMAELEKQVELMLQSGQTVADCECKRDTLKDILKMLQTSEVCKIVKNKNTENKPEKEDKEEHQEKQISNIQEQTEVVLKVQVDDIETSDEFNSDSTSSTKNQISEVIQKLDADEEKGKTKTVTFSDNPTCIDMMVQLHQTLDDTVSVNELVIDESKKEVTDTGKEDDTVTEIINDIMDTVVTNLDCSSEELTSIQPCSQMPRVDPYQKFLKVADASHDDSSDHDDTRQIIILCTLLSNLRTHFNFILQFT